MTSFRLLRTTAFRSALAYACLYSLLAALGMGFIYWSTASHIQQQVDSRLRLESSVLLGLYRDRALPALTEAIRQRSREDSQGVFFYLLQSPDHQPLAGHLLRWPSILSSSEPSTVAAQEVFVRRPSELRDNDPVRVLVTPLPGDYKLLVGRDLIQEQRLLEHTLTTIVLSIISIFLLALGASVWLGRRTLQRIDAVSRTAHEIMAGDLSRRLPVTQRDDEFDQLGRELNAMLERIEQLLAGLRQVSDNIAHDLRSPLSRLRNRLEVTLLEARSADEYHRVLEQTVEEADELLKTFNALLSIAQAEAGISRESAAPIALAELLEDLADLYGAAAEEQGLQLQLTLNSHAHIHGNRRLLTQAVANLLENALKYTPTGGQIELTLSQAAQTVCLSVADNGQGIPEHERERVLQRFVRLDNARSTPGNGLGLALVQAVARLHRAQLCLLDNHPGLRVELRFVL